MKSRKSWMIGLGGALLLSGLSAKFVSWQMDSKRALPDLASGVGAASSPIVSASRAPAAATTAINPASVTGASAASTSAAVIPATSPISNLPSSLSSLQSLLTELRRLQACYDSDCDFPRTDVKSYDFAVGREIKKTIYAIESQVQTNQLVDPWLAETAREFLRNSDGHVKEAALHLLSTQPISPESRDSVLQNVIQDYDAELIEHALLELNRYQDPRDREIINRYLNEAMATGAPFVSQRVAQNISPFLRADTVRIYEALAAKLPKGSVTYQHLRGSLDQYYRHASGA